MESRTAQDQRVVREVLAGSAEAFTELVERYQKLVASVAWRYGVGRQEIEDVVSEVFFKAYSNLSMYKPEHPFATWLYRLAANHVVDHGRRRRRDALQDELPEQLMDPKPGADLRSEERERATAVHTALQRVKPRYREVLFLVYIEGFKVDDAARELGLPTGTVKSRLMRGREALGKVLSSRHPELFRV